MLRDLGEGEEKGQGKRLSAPRPSLNWPHLKMHLDSMQLRCVILGACIREDEVYIPSITSGGGVESWDIQHSP